MEIDSIIGLLLVTYGMRSRLLSVIGTSNFVLPYMTYSYGAYHVL